MFYMRIQLIDGADLEFTENTIGALIEHLTDHLMKTKNDDYFNYRGHFILKRS